MADSTKVICPENVFLRKSQSQMSHVPWTYNICAFDIGSYYEYYWQNHDFLQWRKQNKTFSAITGNKYSTLFCY